MFCPRGSSLVVDEKSQISEFGLEFDAAVKIPLDTCIPYRSTWIGVSAAFPLFPCHAWKATRDGQTFVFTTCTIDLD